MSGIFRWLGSFLFPITVAECDSEVSGKLRVIYSKGKYQLDTLGVNYSFGGLHGVFQKSFDQYNIGGREIKNVLILGFGSGSVAYILQHEYRKDVKILGVEKDEAVIGLAKKYFSIDKYKGLALECAEAYDLVCGGGKYSASTTTAFDLVVMDIFVDLLVPDKFQDDEFLSGLSRLLSPDGILFYNFISRDVKTRDAGGKLFQRMNALIGNTEWVRLPAKRTENWVFVCDRNKTKKP